MRILFLSISGIMGLWIICGLCTIPKEKEIQFQKQNMKIPLFVECLEDVDDKQHKKCSDKAILNFIKSQFPFEQIECLEENNRIIVSFKIDTLGFVFDPKVLRSPCDDYNFLIKGFINNMPKWERVAYFNDKKFISTYTLPIKKMKE